MALACADCGDPMVVPGEVCQACVDMYENIVREDTRTRNDQFKTLGAQNRDMWARWWLNEDPGAGA